MPASKTTHPLQIISSVSNSPPTSDHVKHQSPPPSSTSLKSTPTKTSNAWLILFHPTSFLTSPPQEVGSNKIAPSPSSHLFSLYPIYSCLHPPFEIDLAPRTCAASASFC
ncbi:unnamed protein product [Lactuca saligna]|uniref:Uncharacterized protein n=1 Tax=Lactuca saligna TaxID=75948 RepID=A0AA36A2W7_LACSI|nr:unnamed protein product [Lactuca saligna]